MIVSQYNNIILYIYLNLTWPTTKASLSILSALVNGMSTHGLRAVKKRVKNNNEFRMRALSPKLSAEK